MAPVRPDQPVSDTPLDHRALQILSTEHWSLLTARSLAYNEALTRGSMFLALLSMSFVGLALLAQAMGFTPDFLVVAALVVALDVLVGLFTFIRIAATAVDDFRAMQGMNRIRHAYVEIAPHLRPYFVTGLNDDPAGIQKSYGFEGPRTAAADVGYGLSTSLGLVGLIVSLLGGLLAAVVALLVGAPGWLTVAAVGLAAGIVLLLEIRWALASVRRRVAGFEIRFPTPDGGEGRP